MAVRDNSLTPDRRVFVRHFLPAGPKLDYYKSAQARPSSLHWRFAEAQPAKLDKEIVMGKYVLGWFLGVPVVVLVIAYMIFH